ncbi:hypothetical protein GE107_07370 [Cohnella sp. CFH 77786]|uniref:hypothetical protein n=1 Tax=Paenibacillaceae TaxID=186822 RepID=UPI001C6089F3|nr:hypothetical protein [Cohnella sp. CFH 77786]MBW5445879.1 hypothetical protein [Cohnella sp. CFH 77786]
MLQMVNEGRPATITEEDDKLVVAPFTFGDSIKCQGGAFSLNEWEGQCFRLYLDADGSLSTDDTQGHFWQLAEAHVPPREIVMVETDERDDNDMPIVVSQKQPLNVAEDVTVSVWAFPE